MAIEETFRREFQTRVEEALDAESARFLMAHLPPVPWPDVATKHDLELLQMATEHKLDVLRAAIDARFTAIDARFTAIDARFTAIDEQLENRFTVHSSELAGGLANQRADLSLLIANQTRTMIIALITAFVAIASLALFR